MIKAHVIRLNPNKEQAQYLKKCADVARFSWNWALGALNEAYTRGERPSPLKLNVEFNRLRSKEGLAPWVADVMACANQRAFVNLQDALSRYHKLRKAGKLKPPMGTKPRKDGKPFGWPKFKRKNDTAPSFGVSNQAMKHDGHTVKISRCPGLINMAEQLRFDGKVMSGGVAYRNGHWYLAVAVEMPDPTEPHPGPPVGIDVGIKSLAVTSDGIVYGNPKVLKRHERRMKRVQRELERRTIGGATGARRRLN